MPDVPYKFNNRRPPETVYDIDAAKVNANNDALVNGSALEDLSISARTLAANVPNADSLRGWFAAHGLLTTTSEGFAVQGAFVVSGSLLDPGSAVVSDSWIFYSSPVAVPDLTLSATNYVYLVQRSGGPYEPESAGFIEVTQVVTGGNRILLYEVVCDGVGVSSVVDHRADYLPAISASRVGGSGLYVLRAGDTMTGELVLPSVRVPAELDASGPFIRAYGDGELTNETVTFTAGYPPVYEVYVNYIDGADIHCDIIKDWYTVLFEDRILHVNEQFDLADGVLAKFTVAPTTDGSFYLEVARTGIAGRINALELYNGDLPFLRTGVFGLNLSVGLYSGDADKGYNNTFIGQHAGEAADGGRWNVFVGMQAGQANSTGGGNTLVGYRSGLVNVTGGTNSFFGYLAGVANVSGNNNSLFGAFAGNNISTGSENVAVGRSSITFNQTGNQNVAVGTHAGRGVVGNSYSNVVAVGYRAGNGLTIGSDNTFVGHYAGYYTTDGDRNTFIGRKAGYSNTGSMNVFIGKEAGVNANASAGNVILGTESGTSLTTGGQNTVLGNQAGNTLVDGNYNILIGGGTYGSAVDVPASDTSNHLNIGNVIKGDLLSGAIGLDDSPTTPEDTTKLRVKGFGYVHPYPDFVGSGLNDLTFGGVYTGTDTGVIKFTIEIQAEGATDTFKWKKGDGAYTESVNCDTSPVALVDGVTVVFGAITGHTAGDVWECYVYIRDIINFVRADDGVVASVDNGGKVTGVDLKITANSGDIGKVLVSVDTEGNAQWADVPGQAAMQLVINDLLARVAALEGSSGS